jgi:hypothetical protein
MELREIARENVGLNSPGSGEGLVAGSCEHDNELSGFLKGGQFLE